MRRLLLSTLCGMLMGCSYETIHNSGAENARQGGEVCSPNSEPIVTYESLRSEIFSSRCFSCHSSATRQAGGVALDSYVNAQRWGTRIRSVTTNNLMPPNPAPPLSPDEKSKIDQWVASGMPERVADNCNPTAPAPPSGPLPPIDEDLKVVPPESEIVFDLVMSKILQPKCVSCHSDTGGNRGRLNLETYFNVVDEIEDVLEEVQSGFMPPAPRPSLSQVEKEVLRIWFQNNMPQ